jgi:hypothetical protein
VTALANAFRCATKLAADFDRTPRWRWRKRRRLWAELERAAERADAIRAQAGVEPDAPSLLEVLADQGIRWQR